MTLVQIDGRDVAERVFAKEAQEVDLSTLTLDELAERANANVRGLEHALARSLDHAVHVGEVLNEVRRRLGGDWVGWTASNAGLSQVTAVRYMRLAHYKERVLGSGLGATEAWMSLRGLPRSGLKSAPDVEEIERVRVLIGAGLTRAEVADVLGCSISTVHRWLHPESADAAQRRSAEKRKRQRAEQRAAALALKEKQKREERDRLARERGGNLGKAYDQVRKLQPIIDAAITEGLSVEARALAVRLEDEIFKALKR